MKNILGCSSNMWLWIAETSMPFDRNQRIDLIAAHQEVA
jgi:hypothetical protein